MKHALILCTGNSCRSQMAEGFWNALGRGEWQAVSAGSKPAAYVHPLAVRVMGEAGIDLSHARSKSLAEFHNRPFDVAVTVCDNARQACPVYPTATEYLHWPFEDPADATGSEDDQLAVFRRVRDEIRDRITRYLVDGN